MPYKDPVAYREYQKRYQAEWRRNNHQKHLASARKSYENRVFRDPECNKRGHANKNRAYIRKQQLAYVSDLQARIPGPRNGYPWLPAEEAILLRKDISTVEKCLMVGRTYFAVTGKMQRMRETSSNTVRLAAIRVRGPDGRDAPITVRHNQDGD